MVRCSCYQSQSQSQSQSQIQIQIQIQIQKSCPRTRCWSCFRHRWSQTCRSWCNEKNWTRRWMGFRRRS